MITGTTAIIGKGSCAGLTLRPETSCAGLLTGWIIVPAESDLLIVVFIPEFFLYLGKGRLHGVPD